MRDKICYIVGAGENYGLDFCVRDGDMVIAADGGIAYLREKGINADLIVGDFDSLPEKPAHSNIVALSREKDSTDMIAAIHEGIDRGYKIFHIYCGTGGRLDHTLANIQALAFLSRNKMRGFLFGGDYVITAVTNGSIAFNSRQRGYISVFSCSDKSAGVFLKGLKYELENAVISNTFPIGVSNEFIGVDSTVTVNDGTLAVIFPKEPVEDLL